ncbi:unnamed protein product [Dracunculus medinensis]|uniref:DNA topoisomerase (ATP-hydrolyzing) n=1 Tax=Dracunculus medinensis TaxID=318479 RepID=A0A0N4UIU0_DRAME|nr:unnamed protein product [Dracunculus medinensis]
MRALAQIYHLHISNAFATKRDLFYEQKALYGIQRNLDKSITSICELIGVNRFKNNVLSSGRGLVVGSLKIEYADRVVDCSITPFILTHFSRNIRFHSSAGFILIVEKDATFQKLIQEGFFSTFSNAILVTGKGYPDVLTRLFLRRLVEDLHLPMYGLMDNDPHGWFVSVFLGI